MRCHSSKRSPADSPEWITADKSPNLAWNHPTVCGVREISGTSIIALFRCFNTSLIRRMYTSVLPLPVTPYSRNVCPECIPPIRLSATRCWSSVSTGSVLLLPFSFTSGNQIVGFDIDLAKLLEEKLNVKTKIIKTDRNKLVTTLKNNDADLIISAFTVCECFQNEIDYSKPYYIGKTAFAIRNDFGKEATISKVPKMTYLEPKKPDEIYKLTDLSGKFVGVQTGTTLDEQVQQLIKLPRIQYFANIPEMTKALEQRNLDGIAVDYSVAESILKQHPDFSILKDRLNKDEFGIAMGKNSPLKASIDSCIKVLQQKGEIQKIKNKWSKNKSAVRVMKQDWIGTDTLVVGTEALYAPYEFYQWGELSGIDIDIMYTIGKMLNKNIKFADMNFDVLIPSLVNEKTDLCIAAMSITEERSSLIDFSIPYDKNESVIVVHTPQHAIEKIGDSTGILSQIFQKIQDLFN